MSRLSTSLPFPLTPALGDTSLRHHGLKISLKERERLPSDLRVLVTLPRSLSHLLPCLSMFFRGQLCMRSWMMQSSPVPATNWDSVLSQRCGARTLPTCLPCTAPDNAEHVGCNLHVTR